MRKGIDLRDIALLARLAETGNLSAAARELGIPPAVASRRLAALEHALGLTLAERTSRSTIVTSQGETLAAAARHMLAEWQGVVGDLTSGEAALSGTLKVSAPHMFGRAVLAPALGSFTSRYPHLRLVIRLSDERLDLAAESIDMAVRIARPSGSEGVARRLARNRRVIVASPDYLERNGIPGTPSDLNEHDCLVPSGRSDWVFERDGERTTIAVKGPIEVNDGAFIRDAAVNGAGIALKSWFDVADLVRDGELQTLLDDYEASPGSEIWLVFRRERANDPDVTAFVAFLEEAIRLAVMRWPD